MKKSTMTITTTPPETKKSEPSWPRADLGCHYSIFRGMPGQFFVYGTNHGLMYFDNFPEAVKQLLEFIYSPKAPDKVIEERNEATFKDLVETQKYFMSKEIKDNNKSIITYVREHNIGLMVLVLSNCFCVAQDHRLEYPTTVEGLMKEFQEFETYRQKPVVEEKETKKPRRESGQFTLEELEELLRASSVEPQPQEP